jgi:predicted transposase/invertase (TIGR01784 family)
VNADTPRPGEPPSRPEAAPTESPCDFHEFQNHAATADNRNLLIHFLNATLGPDLPSPVTQVDILNPYNEREFLTDKVSIVDVKARDDHARLYQAEIQLRK